MAMWQQRLKILPIAPYRGPHRLNLSFQSSRSCALPNIKVLKDKDLEFANSIRPLSAHTTKRPILAPIRAQKLNSQINVQIGDGQEVFGWSTAGNTSQSHSGYPRWVTENIGNLVN
jgi:hypothetical protein